MKPKGTLRITRLFLPLVLFVFFSCDSEEEVVATEADELEDMAAASSCDSCNGSDPSDVYPVVQSMRLENKGSGSNLGGETDADGHCNTNYFSMCRNYMVLTAPGNSGSRTELKFGSDYNMSLNDFSQLRFTMILENVPSNSSDPKKGVSIGQIHARSTDDNPANIQRPLLRIDATTSMNKVRWTLADGYNSGSSDSDGDLINFSDGDRIYIVLRIKSSNNQVEVFAKNDYTGQTTTKTFTVSGNWLDLGKNFYYKTGVYQQVGSGSNDHPRASYNYFKAESI